MAALPKFSFTGWSSSRISPQVNPATAPGAGFATGPGASIEGGMSIENGIVYQNGKLIGLIGSPAAMALGAASSVNTGPGQLVGTTNAANTNLPAWLQTEVDRLNAQDALRKQLTGQVTGGGAAPTQNIGDILQGVAANTAARSQFNQQVFGMNEAARLQNLVQQRNQLRPTGGFGFNSPLDIPRQLALDRQIEDYQRVNLPISAGGNFRPSGWTSPNWAQPTWR